MSKKQNKTVEPVFVPIEETEQKMSEDEAILQDAFQYSDPRPTEYVVIEKKEGEIEEEISLYDVVPGTFQLGTTRTVGRDTWITVAFQAYVV